MRTKTSTTTGAALTLVATLLVACGSASADSDSPARDQRIVEKAQRYTGESQEERYRRQFFVESHFHDSWNPCHLGEVPKSQQGSGPECYSRLRSQTGR